MVSSIHDQLGRTLRDLYIINRERSFIDTMIPTLYILTLLYILPKAAATETGVAEEFHVSKTVTILGISLFVEGLGCGPLLLGPLSEFYGRNPVYLISYSLFWVFSWPVAFAPNIGT